MPEQSGHEVYSNLNGANNAAHLAALTDPHAYGAAPVAHELTRKQKHNKKAKSYKVTKKTTAKKCTKKCAKKK